MIDFFVILGAVFSLISLVILSVGMTDASGSGNLLDRLKKAASGLYGAYSMLVESDENDEKTATGTTTDNTEGEQDVSLFGAATRIMPAPFEINGGDSKNGGKAPEGAEGAGNVKPGEGNGGRRPETTGPGPTRTPTTPTTTPSAVGGGDSTFLAYLMADNARKDATITERHHQGRMLYAQKDKDTSVLYERLLAEKGGGANFNELDRRYVLKEEADEKYLTEEKLEGILRDNYGLGEKTIDYLTDLVDKAPNKVKEILKEKYNLDENTLTTVFKDIITLKQSQDHVERRLELDTQTFNQMLSRLGELEDAGKISKEEYGGLKSIVEYNAQKSKEFRNNVERRLELDTQTFNQMLSRLGELEDAGKISKEEHTELSNVLKEQSNLLSGYGGQIDSINNRLQRDAEFDNQLLQRVKGIESYAKETDNYKEKTDTTLKKLTGHLGQLYRQANDRKTDSSEIKKTVDKINQTIEKYGEQLLKYGDSIGNLQGQIKDRPTRRAVKKHVNEQLNGMIGQYTELKDRLEGLEKSGLIDNKTYIEITQKLEIYGKAIEELKKGGGNTFNQIINTTGEVINYQGPGGRVAQINVTDPGSNKTLDIFGGGAPKYLQKGSNEK